MGEAIAIKALKLALAATLGFAAIAVGWRVTSAVLPGPAPQPTQPPTVLVAGDQTIEFVVDRQPGQDAQPLPPPDPEKPPKVDRPELHEEPNKQAEDQLNRPRPRIDPITQFDHGPKAGLNCTMAAGAMLLELATGYVTTGSALRRLQSDNDGGTDLLDLQHAVQSFHPSFKRRSLMPHELRQLMYAGAGAVIQGVYSVLGDYREASFRGPHAIYLDGFRPPDEANPARYYVIDPIVSRRSYRGRWVPARIVEDFATQFGGGSIYASWAFPGNAGPSRYPELPSFAERGPDDKPQKPPSGGHKSTETKLPQDDPNAGSHDSDDPGPPPPPDDHSFDNSKFTGDLGDIVGLARLCVVQPVPTYCPRGILADIPAQLTLVPIDTGPPDEVDMLYAVPIGPDDLRVIFTIPPGSIPDLSYWQTGVAGASLLRATDVQTAEIDGKTVGVATMSLSPGASYQFVAGASATGLHAVSSVAAITP